MAIALFWTIIGFILLDFIFEKVLDYLNFKNMKEEIPEELKGIYDEEKYKKSQRYEKVTSRFSLVTSIFSLSPYPHHALCKWLWHDGSMGKIRLIKHLPANDFVFRRHGHRV